MVRKKFLRLEQKAMSAAMIVEDACRMARSMVAKECRGGDVEDAMRRLESRTGVSFRTFWALRYRPPKDIMASVYLRLVDAYQSEIQRQKRLVDHEIAIEKAKSGPRSALVRAAAALAGEGE